MKQEHVAANVMGGKLGDRRGETSTVRTIVSCQTPVRRALHMHKVTEDAGRVLRQDN
jgi:hypothetical protein